MLYFSSLLNTARYRGDAERLFCALDERGVGYRLLNGARDIWLRDFMPIKTGDGRYVSFRYEPSYHKPEEIAARTDYRRDLEKEVGIAVGYSGINLDGGNAVFSLSRKTAVVSDRVFSENPERERAELQAELEQTLAAKVIIIPALGEKHDYTGHADVTVRFISETTAVGNRTPYKNGNEQKIKKALKEHGIDVIDFPYFDSKGISAVGSYLNFLETEKAIFLPVFGSVTDVEAIAEARRLFTKEAVPVRCEEIAKDGGCLNCISWES